MKYHSLSWWRRALLEQFKLFVRNQICRDLLKIDFGFRVPDLLTLFIQDRSYFLYDALTQKYPELRRIEKYVKAGKAFTCMEMTAAGIFFFRSRLQTAVWAYDADVSDIVWLLEQGLPSLTQVRLHDGTVHSVTVVAYDDDTDEIIYHDSLGDPAFRHKLVWGFAIRSKIAKFLKICVGNPLRMVSWIPDDRSEILSAFEKRFVGRKLYTLGLRDYNVTYARPDNTLVAFGAIKNDRIELKFPPGNDGKVVTSVMTIRDPTEDIRPTYAQFSTVRLLSGYDAP